MAKKLHGNDVKTVIWNKEKKNGGGRDSDGEAEGEGEAETFENSKIFDQTQTCFCKNMLLTEFATISCLLQDLNLHFVVVLSFKIRLNKLEVRSKII